MLPTTKTNNLGPSNITEESYETQKAALKAFILDNEFFFLPLHSTSNSSCSCNNAECTSPGKHPVLKWNWKILASNKTDFVESWFCYPEVINYGVLTGRWSKKTGKYLVVIDIDTPEHPILKELPKTFRYRTGSGGWHYWYLSKYCIPNSVSKLAPKVDVRGNNGYVVVPPSSHISGGSYIAEEGFCEIADLPKFVISRLYGDDEGKRELVSTSFFAGRKVAKGSKISKVLDANLSLWSRANISQIREWLRTGKQIPEGTRNVTVHRLLCSDRAKGCSETELETNAKYYLSCCQTGNRKYSQYEVNATLAQVAKYRTYNTSYEKVHSAFYEVVKKSKRIKFTPQDLKRMEKVDAEFFQKRLSISTDKNRWVSLEALSVARDEHMKNAGFSTFSRYPQHLLAGKLRSLGFERRRTAKQNVWNVEISAEINELKISEKPAKLVERSRSTALSLSEIPAQKEPLHMTMKIEEVKINVKLKKHPSAGRYPGWPNQELGSAVLKYMELLEPTERAEFLSGTLVVDEEETALDFDAVRVGDRIGTAFFAEGSGWIASQFDVVEIGKDILYCEGATTYEYESRLNDAGRFEVTFEDASVARALGFFEILYRPEEPWNGVMEDRKLIPYGIDLNQEVKLLIQTEAEEEASTPAPVEETAEQKFMREMAEAGITDPLVIEAMAKAASIDLTPPPVAPEQATLPKESE